jgi:hypothetical protein
MAVPLKECRVFRRAQPIRLALLLCSYISIHAISLLYVLHYTSHRIAYDGQQLPYAIASVAALSLALPLFIFTRFSFGYLVGFYFYTMVLGFIELSWFTDLNYDLQSARISAVASIIAFLLPALFISAPIRRTFELSPLGFERLSNFLLALSIATIATAALYNFRLVALDQIYDSRAKLQFPAPVRYMIGIISSAILPFLFACAVSRRNFWQAGLLLFLLMLFYPITLSKLSFFAPVWLLGLAIGSRVFEPRVTAILSLLLPMLVGVVLIILFKEQARDYFDVINLRMIAVPSSAINVYNDFFSRNDVTYFCQILILKSLLNCPYQEPLATIFERVYGLGNFNASLFATEGIASVGTLFAAGPVFLCGLAVAVANRLSAGLPPRSVLLSSAVLAQIFLNVPFTTTLLTHGAAILFLLWYLTPRVLFERPTATGE